MAEAAGARGDVEECKKFMDKVIFLNLKTEFSISSLPFCVSRSAQSQGFSP